MERASDASWPRAPVPCASHRADVRVSTTTFRRRGCTRTPGQLRPLSYAARRPSERRSAESKPTFTANPALCGYQIVGSTDHLFSTLVHRLLLIRIGFHCGGV